MKRRYAVFALLLSACAPALTGSGAEFVQIGDRVEVSGTTRDGRVFKKAFVVAKKEAREAIYGGGFSYASAENPLLYAAYSPGDQIVSVSGFWENNPSWYDLCMVSPSDTHWTRLTGKLISLNTVSKQEKVTAGIENPTVCVMTRIPTSH